MSELYESFRRFIEVSVHVVGLYFCSCNHGRLVKMLVSSNLTKLCNNEDDDVRLPPPLRDGALDKGGG